jgi:predicted  nucleic acid-binding Zn-ribbon protein
MRTNDEIDEFADMIDPRDIADRINYLESEIEDRESQIDEAETTIQDTEEGREIEELQADIDEWRNEIEEFRPELKELQEFYNDINQHETLINERYFEDYARDLAEDIGAMENCSRWPATCIDWERAAHELQMDYSSAELRGQTFYYRS